MRLEIYNSTGRLVKTLVDRPLPAGEYEVGWDGSDVNGGHAASGIYYYRQSELAQPVQHFQVLHRMGIAGERHGDGAHPGAAQRILRQ